MHRDYRIDPFTVEVIRHKLDGIASEMELTLVRSAFSNIVKEALDASASLFTVRGETLAQAIANPAHLAMLYPMVQVLLRTYPIETMSEGDAYILNDPYDGGSHLPDIVIIMPVMFKGRPIAISTALAHHQDIGGMVPGSMPTNATSIFQEGIRIPPLKLRDKGSFNETLLSMLKRNVRLPDVLIGDLNAEIAACTIGVRRLNELAETYGANELLVVFDELLDRAETLTRQALLSIPDGTYHYEDFLDNDGVELDKRVRISVNVTIEGSTMTCDFTGTSVQVKGPINCVPSGSYAAACFAVRAIAGPDIPNNGGCYRPLQFKLPRGSLVDPVEPAPVGCRAAALIGQSYHLEIPLHMDDPKPIDRLVHQFRADHDRVYGYSTDAPAAIVNLRCVHHVDGRNALPDTPASRTKRNTRDRQRPVRLDSASTFVNASIHDRDGLTTGALINGPAIVEQADTTTLIEPRWQATVDTKGNLVLEPST
jgi:N-methylhydantoinase B